MEQEIRRAIDTVALTNNAPQEGYSEVQQLSDEENGEMVVASSRIPSAQEEALVNFGNDLFKDSVTRSVEFNKTMLGFTATFATLMASTFGYLAFGQKDKQLDGFQSLFLIVPALLMLLGSVCFALGYYPRPVAYGMGDIKEIRKARDRLLQTRKNCAFCGMLFFVLSIVMLVVGIAYLNLS